MTKFSKFKVYADLSWEVYDDEYTGSIMKDYDFLKNQQNTNSGFAAKLVKNKNTGELVLVVRGTEMKKDFFNDLIIADGNLALNSMPSSQVADMINFINSIKNIFYEAKNSGKKVTTVGHSLGGALAQIASKSFSNLFDECYTL